MELDYYLVEDAANLLGVSPRFIYHLGVIEKIPLFIYNKEITWRLADHPQHFCYAGLTQKGFIRLDSSTIQEVECTGSSKLRLCHIDNPSKDFLKQVSTQIDPFEEKLPDDAIKKIQETETITVRPNRDTYIGLSGKHHGEHGVFILKAELELVKAMAHSNNKTANKREKHTPLLAKKTENTYLRTIYTLSGALIKGLSGVKSKDAEAVLAHLDSLGIDRPISSKKLAEILSEAGELQIK